MSEFDEWNKAINNLPFSVKKYNLELATKLSKSDPEKAYEMLNIRSAWLIQYGKSIQSGIPNKIHMSKAWREGYLEGIKDCGMDLSDVSEVEDKAVNPYE
jgi:hypothetical protein